MLGKVFLLSVVCLSLVQVRGDEEFKETTVKGLSIMKWMNGNENSQNFADVIRSGILSESRDPDNTSHEKLEEAIEEAIFIAEDVKTVTIQLLNKEWNNLNEVRRILMNNAMDYIERTEMDRKGCTEDSSKSNWNSRRTGYCNYLYNTVESVRKEAEASGKPHVVTECIDEVEEKAKEDVKATIKRLMAQILTWNYQFNTTYPDFPFQLVEEELQDLYQREIYLIKSSSNTESVESQMAEYIDRMGEMHSSFMEKTQAVNKYFFEYQLKFNRSYRAAKKEIEKLFIDSFQNMRKCLDTRELIFGKLLRFSKIK